MATPSYSVRFSAATSRASPAASFVSTKVVAWNPSERSFSWTAAAISRCLPNPRMRQPVGREEEAIDTLELNLLQFDKYHVSIRISYVFADVHMPFHPDNASCFDVNILLPTIGECQTPLERRLGIQHVVRVSVL